MCSTKETSLDAVMDIMMEKLDAGGTVTFTPHGNSMRPMLRDGEDVVVLSKPHGRLRLYDVPLYRRENGQYVMHRVIDFCNDGSYVLCGDNQFKKEKGIRDDQIIAVMTGFVRKGTGYDTGAVLYRLYVTLWYHSRPFRRVFRTVKRRMGFTGKQEKKEKN